MSNCMPYARVTQCIIINQKSQRATEIETT